MGVNEELDTNILDTNEGNGATPNGVDSPSSGSEGVYTIDQYLIGKVRTTIPTDAIYSILADANVIPGTPLTDLTEMQRDLAIAYMYVWAAAAPSTSSRIKDSDGNWSHEEGSETFDASARRHFLLLANALFKKHGIQPIGSTAWKVSGRGFGHIRNYGK